MDSFKRFNKEQWYDKKRFYSSVKDGATGDNGEKLDGHISDKEYLTCNKIWNEFNMKNMGDYHDDYLKEDICYRLMFLKTLLTRAPNFCHPCHYFSSPGLGWDTMLRITGAKLEKPSDTDMYLFIKKGLKGGISYIAKRYSEANNKYLKHYDPIKLS